MQALMGRLQDSSKYLDDTSRLNRILSDEGYIFLRGVLGRKKILAVSDDIIGVLKHYGFVPPSGTDPTWSGRVPGDNALAQGFGGVQRGINNLQSIKELIRRGNHVKILKRLSGGEIFSWVDNMDRGIRIMLPGRLSYSNVGGVKGTTVTPPHQDNYFFRLNNYYTTWIPLMDIDESVGGLAIAERSHLNGYYEHWFRGSESLGVPANREEARRWSKSNGVPGTGDVRAENFVQRWLNIDYRAGDLLLFSAMMLHKGLENTSNKIRISADIRYQKRGTPTVWRARHKFTYSQNYAAEMRKVVGELSLDPVLAQRVIDKLYVEGPTRNKTLNSRVDAAVKELTATGSTQS